MKIQKTAICRQRQNEYWCLHIKFYNAERIEIEIYPVLAEEMPHNRMSGGDDYGYNKTISYRERLKHSYCDHRYYFNTYAKAKEWHKRLYNNIVAQISRQPKRQRKSH